MKRLLQIQKSDVITGFSLRFCKKLLKKLQELQEQDKIFEHGLRNAKLRCAKGPDWFASLTPLAYAITNHLSEQLRCNWDTDSTTPSRIKNLLTLAEEFLAIFNKK